MITLVFLVCSQQCVSIVHPQLYKTYEECETVAVAIIDKNKQDMEKGLLQPHKADFRCIGWGESA